MADVSPPPRAARAMPRLRHRYEQDVVAVLQREFGYRNPMEVPRLRKVVLNIGLGEATKDAKSLEAASRDLGAISGQRPVLTRAKKSIAAFGRLRKGMAIGSMVTLRGERMYEFLDRLMSLALPRLRDFRGVSAKSFDGRGNYSLGLKEQVIFPEIEYDRVDKMRGLEISVVTSARTDEEGKRLLELLGMPFTRNQG